MTGISAPEMSKVMPAMSLAFIVGLFFVGYQIGELNGESAGVANLNKANIEHTNEITELKHRFTLAEVDGVRSDMRLADAIIWDEMKSENEEIRKTILLLIDKINALVPP